MICPACASAADLVTLPAPQIKAARSLAVDMHGSCRGGTWCSCQHVVPPLEVIAARRAAMPAGGLARVVAALGHMSE